MALRPGFPSWRDLVCGGSALISDSSSEAKVTTTERALNSGDYIALRFDTLRDNALTCCADTKKAALATY